MESRNIRLWNCNVLWVRVQDLCHITPLLAELHWLPVRARIHYKILLITFKSLHGLSPKYLSDLISIQQPSSYHLRCNDNGRLLESPSTKTKKTLGDRAFQVAAPFLWNKLPRSAREATNLESFKTLINKCYCYCYWCGDVLISESGIRNILFGTNRGTKHLNKMMLLCTDSIAQLSSLNRPVGVNWFGQLNFSA